MITPKFMHKYCLSIVPGDEGAIFTSGAMREFPITLRHTCKASQQPVPWQWIWKARIEGIIWFRIYSSGQFLQQSILINKLKPCKKKKKQKTFESFQLQQAQSRLYGPTQTPWTLLLQKIYFYLGYKIDPLFPNTKIPFKWDPDGKNKCTQAHSLGLISLICYFIPEHKTDLNAGKGNGD